MSAKVTTSAGETRREMWIGLKSLGWSRPADAVISASSCSAARWKLATTWILSGTTSGRWRCGTGAATPAGDHDEAGMHAGFERRLADRQERPLVAGAELEAGGLAARLMAHLGDERHHLDRRREGRVVRRRDAVLAHRHAAR